MSRSVQQREFCVLGAEHSLLGEDGDAALPLLFVGIKEGIARVDTSGLPEHAGLAEQRLGQSGFAGIDVGEDTNGKFFQIRTSFLKYRCSAALVCGAEHVPEKNRGGPRRSAGGTGISAL